MEKGVITNSQFTILVIMFLIGSSTLIAPPLLVMEAKRDAWISGLLAISIGLFFAWLCGVLAHRDPELSLAQKCERILGKWPGKLVALLFVLFFLLLTSALVRIIGDFLTTLIITETPIQAAELAMLLVVVMGARLGLEVFARTAEILIPWIMMFFIILTAFLLPEIHLSRLTPVLEEGMRPVLFGLYPLFGIPYMDLIVFLTITPYVAKTQYVGQNLRTGVWIGGGILAMNAFLAIAVLGADFTSQLNYPIYGLAEKIQIGKFIQRVEVLSGGLMFITLFMKIIICFYATATSAAEMLGLKTYRSLTYPLGLLVLGLSVLIAPNIIYFQRFALESWSPLCSVFGFLLPLLLLIVRGIRRSGA
ncbi:GerAB/ArcD/ProY family transporter [Gorillibacterium sp. sgz5001074]|uniref:GerAB/ArcD/ProY family transporter n=1 Tax=Gorillibacterium sp. sgz5001074 TaxID=3446695 RepID=UPI003F663E34